MRRMLYLWSLMFGLSIVTGCSSLNRDNFAQYDRGDVMQETSGDVELIVLGLKEAKPGEVDDLVRLVIWNRDNREKAKELSVAIRFEGERVFKYFFRDENLAYAPKDATEADPILEGLYRIPKGRHLIRMFDDNEGKVWSFHAHINTPGTLVVTIGNNNAARFKHYKGFHDIP